MAKRKPISDALRFEIFKRDKFQCQYCGRTSPDVVLNVDHIQPVSKGGTNELLNLVTSCKECNQGKSNKLLSDDSVIQRQREMLADLETRKQQLEMMLLWRQSMSDEKEMEVNAYTAAITKLTGYGLSETGRRNAAAAIRKYGLSEMLDAIETSANQYLRSDKQGNLTKESVEKAIVYASKIAHHRKNGDSDFMYQAAYVNGILRNRKMLYGPLAMGAMKTIMGFIKSNGEQVVIGAAKQCETPDEFIEYLSTEF